MLVIICSSPDPLNNSGHFNGKKHSVDDHQFICSLLCLQHTVQRPRSALDPHHGDEAGGHGLETLGYVAEYSELPSQAEDTPPTPGVPVPDLMLEHLRPPSGPE